MTMPSVVPDVPPRSSQMPHSSPVKNDGTSPLFFLDLPPELRNMIYEELLVVGRIRYKTGEKYNRSPRKPQLALLRVCKQIHQEAEPLYLSKNLFMFPYQWYIHGPFCESSSFPPLFSTAGFEYIKNINLKFDGNQVVYTEPAEDWSRYEYQHGPGSYMQLTETERRDEMHSWQRDELQEAWTEMQQDLCKFKSLEYVEADYRNMYCFGGCCRPLTICNSFWISYLRPKTIKITGLLAGEQETFCSHFDEDIYTAEEMEAKYNLHFMKPLEKWNWNPTGKEEEEEDEDEKAEDEVEIEEEVEEEEEEEEEEEDWDEAEEDYLELEEDEDEDGGEV